MNKFIIFIFAFCMFYLPSFGLDYNYLSTEKIPIKLSPIEEISTKNPPNEGTIKNFKIIGDVIVDGEKIVNGNSIVTGKVETIITSGMNGFPAEIILGDFEIPNIKKSGLTDTYIKSGQNRCFWVYPLKWALTPIPPTGSLTNLIMGGHAKIKTNEIITIYYYPEWK